MTEPIPEYVVPRAATPWRALKAEIALGAVGVLVPVVSLAADVSLGKAEWFPRSGAVATLIGAILAFRSVNKHYFKFFAAFGRGFPLATSPNQWKVDAFALVLTVGGTVIWAYGDLLLRWAHFV